MTVKYKRDEAGLVSQVWLLTRREEEQLPAGPPAELQARYGVKLQMDERVAMLPAGATTTVSIHGAQRPLREWLHQLLGRENLTCRLDGETLVIEPLD